MTESIKSKSKKAILWSAFDKTGTQVISILIGLVLARLISPHEYGLVGMIGIFSALAGVILDSGFSSAIIRKTDCTEKDLNTVFFFNLSISVFSYAILFFCAPFIADYFHQPILKPLSRVVFLTLIINSLGIIQNAVLTKQLDYKTTAFINMASLIVSSATALTFAILGFGVWTLVAQMIAQAATRVALLWINGRWAPRLIFSTESLKELFSYSSNLLIASICGVFFQNAYTLILGKFYTPNAAGYYTQANKWSDMFSSTLYSIIIGATYPIFSTVQNDKELLFRTYQKTMRLTAFVVFPVLMGAALVGQSLINILLGSKWVESGILFQILCLGGIFTPFTGLNANFILVKGDSRVYLKIEIAKAILAILFLLVTVRISIMAIIAGQMAVRLIHYLLVVIVVGKRVDYPWTMQLKDMFPYIALSLLMVTCAFPLRLVIHNDYILLPLQIIVSILFYFLANKKLDSKVFEEVLITFKLKKG